MQPDHMSSQTRPQAATSYDAGLRTFFQKVYNTMAIGLVFTGLIAWVTAHSPLANIIYGNSVLHMIVMFAPLAFLFFGFTPRRIQTMSATKIAGLFYAFSGMFGLSLSYIFLLYGGESIARVFFITAAMFAGISIFGYTTKRDLSSMGSLMIMGAWGLLIAMIVNLFLHSAMLHFVISAIGVIVYTGLVAFDTQNLKRMYSGANGTEANQKIAVMGALSLYINFIMLFQFLLQFMGSRN